MPATPAPVERYRSARTDAGHAVIEGFHALKHALRFGAEILDARAMDPAEVAGLAAALAPDLADRMAALITATDAATFARLAPRPHPTGVIALARRPAVEVVAVMAEPGPAPVVLLCQPTHHGNMGAAIRVAAAAGARAVLVTGPHDPWHPAALRGGAGLQFALPVVHVDGLPATDRPIIALAPEGDPAGQVPVPERAILVFGSERTGVPDALLRRASRRVALPMRPGVSSLNLATAVAVTLYCMALPGPSSE